MKKRILKEELIWFLIMVTVTAIIVVFYPSKEHWGERLWDQIIYPGEPLEGDEVIVGEPPLFSVKVPYYNEWEIGDQTDMSLLLRRDDDEAPVRIEVTVEPGGDSLRPRTYRELKAYMAVIEGNLQKEGFSVIKSKTLYINGERWGLFEMREMEKHTNLYVHRSDNFLFKVNIEFPEGEGYKPRESSQLGRAVAYSLKILVE